MKTFSKFQLIFVVVFFMSSRLISQDFSFVFYNVENLFDVKDDILTNDDEFTPEGVKAWTYEKYHRKVDHIARVLVGVGAWELPALVGLCEVENKKVLYDLTAHRLLVENGYHIIHKDSPDRRGIDVGLLYNESIFYPISTKWYEVVFDTDTSQKTRDILYVKGQINEGDTLHIFINHWPSRWGGVAATQGKRVEVAGMLKEITDSLFLAEAAPNILIAGDFNDTPADSSLLRVLDAREEMGDKQDGLVNLMYPMHVKGGMGTLKYRENWEVFDQIIISTHNMELEHSKLFLNGPYIYQADFLLCEDERYLGMKPFRTYSGPRYHGGFSDHLPVYIRFQALTGTDELK